METDMNKWIRDRHNGNVARIGRRSTTMAPAQPEEEAAPTIPPGNAGNGTGSPPPDMRSTSQRLNDAIRQASTGRF